MMTRSTWTMALVLAGVVVGLPSASEAGSRSKPAPVVVIEDGVEHPASPVYRRQGTRVRGFLARRGGYFGGYSYTVSDIFNTYGDSRTKFGSTSSYRDPMVDRQTMSGPFDHGFFFESGIAPRGGNSPYPN